MRAKLENAEVVGITLTWYEERGGASSISGWGRYLLPGGEEWLKDLHAAIEEMLKQIRYRTDRKNLLLWTGMISPREDKE